MHSLLRYKRPPQKHLGKEPKIWPCPLWRACAPQWASACTGVLMQEALLGQCLPLNRVGEADKQLVSCRHLLGLVDILYVRINVSWHKLCRYCCLAVANEGGEKDVSSIDSALCDKAGTSGMYAGLGCKITLKLSSYRYFLTHNYSTLSIVAVKSTGSSSIPAYLIGWRISSMWSPMTGLLCPDSLRFDSSASEKQRVFVSGGASHYLHQEHYTSL